MMTTDDDELCEFLSGIVFDHSIPVPCEKCSLCGSKSLKPQPQYNFYDFLDVVLNKTIVVFTKKNAEPLFCYTKNNTDKYSMMIVKYTDDHQMFNTSMPGNWIDCFNEYSVHIQSKCTMLNIHFDYVNRCIDMCPNAPTIKL